MNYLYRFAARSAEPPVTHRTLRSVSKSLLNLLSSISSDPEYIWSGDKADMYKVSDCLKGEHSESFWTIFVIIAFAFLLKLSLLDPALVSIFSKHCQHRIQYRQLIQVINSYQGWRPSALMMQHLYSFYTKKRVSLSDIENYCFILL